MDLNASGFKRFWLKDCKLQTHKDKLQINKGMEQSSWVIHSLLGKGSFGTVYSAHQRHTGNGPRNSIAIKIGTKTQNLKPEASSLGSIAYERKIYDELWKAASDSASGFNLNIPKIYHLRVDQLIGNGEVDLSTVDPDQLLGLELLGNSLNYYFRYRCEGLFSVKTVCLIGIHCLDLIKNTHSCGYIHRDIKPDNFLFGRDSNARKLYLIDFGLAKKYKNDEVHITLEEHHKLIGTARYCSVNCHKGIEMSRRDDLEALGYMLLYFRLGQLPWQNLAVDPKNRPKTSTERYVLIGQAKQSLSTKELCRNLKEPEQSTFIAFIDYCRHLKFAQRPDYRYLRELLKSLLVKLALKIDKYDWE